jgi:hypothetical protein
MSSPASDQWTSEVVGEGRWHSLLVDSQDSTWVVFVDKAARIRVAHRSSEFWQVSELDATVSYPPVTEIDEAYDVHVCWCDEKETLKHASRSSGWKPATIDNQGHCRVDRVIAALDRTIHVLYREDVVRQYLKYAQRSSDGQWALKTIDDRVYMPYGPSRMGIDANGTVHICYYATKHEGQWQTTIIDDRVNYSSFFSIVLDSKNGPHVTYSANTGGKRLALIHANSGSGQWKRTVIDTMDPGTHYHLALTVDSKNILHVAYNHPGDSLGLKYANNHSGFWNVSIIDKNAFRVSSKNIVVDHAGNVHICFSLYGSPIGADLKYISNDSGSWIHRIIDKGVGITGDPFMALDSQGYVHLIYTEASSMLIKHATNAPGSQPAASPSPSPTPSSPPSWQSLFRQAFNDKAKDK